MTPAIGYTQMKDSGVAWIGEIPENWEIVRIHSLFNEVSERYNKDIDEAMPLLSVSEYYSIIYSC